MADKQFVMFKVGDEKYAVDILNIGGIVEYNEITKVPNAPYFVEGMINLRGEIVPIVSLKKRFGMEEKAVNSDTRIVLYGIDGKNIGFIVDEASQVITLLDEDIEPAPGIVSGIDKEYISGIGKNEGEILIILDLKKILTDAEKRKVIAV